MVALTRAVGRKHAMEMLLSGSPIDARTAERWGLVNRVVPDSELVAESRKLALQIVEASPLVLQIGKQAFYAQIDFDQKKAYAYTKEVMSLNAMAADARPQGDGRRRAVLRLVAGMLGAGVSVDALIRRDAQRRARRMAGVAPSRVIEFT